MYKINLEEKGNNKYYYTTKNEAGQILYLEFSEERTQKHVFYFVMFHIGKRKKGFQYMTTIGKDGLKSLIWAKKCIKHFIKHINSKDTYYWNTDKDIKHTIVVFWDDNKRRDAYYYGLKTLRFYFGVYEGRKGLMCNIK